MTGPFLGRFPKPVWDINSGLDSIAGDPALSVDNYTKQLLQGLHGVRQNGKLFVIGFIPPEITVNFIAFENKQRQIATVFGGTNTSPKKGNNNSSRNELKPRVVDLNNLDLGKSYNKSLRNKGYSQEAANRLTSKLVAQAAVENGTNRSSITTKNYNVGNILTGTPGKFKDPSGKNVKNNYSIPPVPPSGGNYVLGTTVINGETVPCYFVASNNLQDATDKHVTVLQQYGLNPNIQTSEDFVKILRPDIYGQAGSVDSPYFTGGNSPDSPEVINYIRGIESESSKYETDLAEFNQNNIDFGLDTDFDFGEGAGSVARNLGTSVMGSPLVTDEEGQDPIRRSGRNVRALNDSRQASAQAQVRFIKQQVEFIQSIPPLAFITGPREFNRSYEPSIDTAKSRTGNISQIWLEKPMKISSSGTTAAQYAFTSQGFGGLTHQNRIYSLSYKNLMSLVRTYKNNGYLYAGNKVFGDNDGIPLFAMSLFIYHDGRIYIGSFDELSVTDSADKPHSMDYSFTFSVRYEIEAADASSGGGF